MRRIRLVIYVKLNVHQKPVNSEKTLTRSFEFSRVYFCCVCKQLIAELSLLA